MRTENTIVIQSSYEEIFRLAAPVEHWREILPHYRYVKLLHSDSGRKWVRMSAWRNFIPVTWTAVYHIEPGAEGQTDRLIFKHVRGLVRGMHVEWWFKPDPSSGTVTVGISHDLGRVPFPTRLLGPKLVEVIVGRGFIGYIAGKTLARIKVLAEHNSASAAKRDR